jgi:hypothetical protein
VTRPRCTDKDIWQVDKDAEGIVTKTKLFGVRVSDVLRGVDMQYVPLTDAK